MAHVSNCTLFFVLVSTVRITYQDLEVASFSSLAGLSSIALHTGTKIAWESWSRTWPGFPDLGVIIDPSSQFCYCYSHREASTAVRDHEERKREISQVTSAIHKIDQTDKSVPEEWVQLAVRAHQNGPWTFDTLWYGGVGPR